MAEDFFAVLLMYPCAALQMDEHMIDEGEYRDSKKDDDLRMRHLGPADAYHQRPELAYPNGSGAGVRPHTNEAYVINEMPRESIHL